MSQVHPFAGLRYSLDHISTLADVISPPYDKISPQERDELWNSHENNIVKLILPPPGGRNVDYATQFSSTEAGDWYAEAAKRLNHWIQEGIFQIDLPQYYIYRQTFRYEDREYTRTGIFVALQLQGDRGPHAHECTFEGPKADRLRLLKATRTNLSPIFLLADGGSEQWQELFRKSSTLVEFQDREGQHHSLHSIADNAILDQASTFLSSRTLVIADGHHRFETAMNYCREMQQQTGRNPDEEPWGRVMALVVPIESPGLLVLPTHRVLSGLPEGWLRKLKESAIQTCEVEDIPALQGDQIKTLLAQEQNHGAVAALDGSQGILIRLKRNALPPALEQVDAPLRSLNVTLLHRLILEDFLGLQGDTLQKNVRYIRGEDQALNLLRSGDANGAFLLRGIAPQDVFQVSQQGVRMPQKSTDFYPKIPTGLVLRSVKDSRDEHENH